MNSAQIRQSFLDFFREKEHTIVPSSSLLPDAPNLLFTNAGMNQFVPIFLGQEEPRWHPPRVVDTQKCIRAGGKHNDLEDVGLDTYHHTFFEMLGNWSFGDYFKKEAIEWAWELLVNCWGFPSERLYATVYCPHNDEARWKRELDTCIEIVSVGPARVHWPDELPGGSAISFSDRESIQYWAKVFIEADLEPTKHIIRGSRADNFWMMGDTGPCGPCSEIHVDLTAEGSRGRELVNKNDPRCIEIWNLVFIQFNANPDGAFTPLPQRHVDTGMGFERVAAIIQGTKNLTDFSGTISNYETDIFRPIFDDLEKLSGKKYGSAIPRRGSAGDSDQEKIDVAFRVIADHIRTLSFAIADGIIPSNEGGGYVLRRILRRAARYGRMLGFHEPFFFKLVDVVAKTMGEVFPEIGARQLKIKETIRREEKAFNKTLDKGLEIFETYTRGLVSALERSSIVKTQFLANETGEPGFAERYAAYLSTTRFAQPSGWNVISGYSRYDSYPTRMRALMEKLQEATSAAQVDSLIEAIMASSRLIEGEFAFKLYDTYGFPLDLTELMARERGLTVDVEGFERLMEEQRARARAAQKKATISIEEENLRAAPTKFLGYDFLETEAVVETVLAGTKPEELNIVLDQTSFYAESGGQVGDRGLLHVPGHDRTEVGQLRVIDTQKRENIFIHRAQVIEGRAPEPGEAVRIAVDVDRRKLIQGHHTVTHLLHWALHKIVSPDVAQKGSYVGPEKLTFDFSSTALPKEKVRGVVKLVNEKVRENAPVSWTEVPYSEAKERKDIQQFFGEKYGEMVRVVQIGGEPQKLNGYSMELCGGTHVRSTSEIGAFRIVKEEAIAAGTRRIEAVAGEAAREWAKAEAQRQDQRFATLRRKRAEIVALPRFDENADTALVLQQIDARAAHLEKLDVDLRGWEKQQAKAGEAQLRSRAAAIAQELEAKYAGRDSLVEKVQDADGNLLQAVADALKGKFKGPIFLASAANGTVALIASVPKEQTAKVRADKLIQQLAPMVGGKGGGRPENARGAGKDVDKIDILIAEAKRLLSSSAKPA
jgi:alanyl-tRNA synthetase